MRIIIFYFMEFIPLPLLPHTHPRPKPLPEPNLPSEPGRSFTPFFLHLKKIMLVCFL